MWAGLAVTRDPPAYTNSEREAKRELYQSRLVRLGGYATKIGLRGRGDLRVGHSQLGSVEQVERLGAEHQIDAAVEWRRLGHGEVPVVHVVSPQIRVHTRRVAKLPSRLWIRCQCGIWYAEAGRVEPSVKPVERRPFDALVAVWIHIRPQAIARSNLIRRGGEGER